MTISPENEHRSSSFPRHRRQSPTTRGGATDAPDDGRTSVGKHPALQEDIHQQTFIGGHGAVYWHGQLLQSRGQGLRLHPEAPRLTGRAATAHDQDGERKP